MELKTATVKLDGIPLQVEYEQQGEDFNIREISHMGCEILSLMSDWKVSQVRKKLASGECREWPK